MKKSCILSMSAIGAFLAFAQPAEPFYSDAEAVAAALGSRKIGNPGNVRIRSVRQVPVALGGEPCVTFMATVTGPQGMTLFIK